MGENPYDVPDAGTPRSVARAAVFVGVLGLVFAAGTLIVALTWEPTGGLEDIGAGMALGMAWLVGAGLTLVSLILGALAPRGRRLRSVTPGAIAAALAVWAAFLA